MPDAMPSDDDRALAGELALGLLEGDERAAALRRLLSDRAFADEVEAWHVRLSPLFDEVVEVAPPQSAWSAIARALPATAQQLPWRTIAAVAMAIAACLALLLVWQRIPEPAAPPALQRILIAQLVDKQGAPLLAASYEAVGGTLRVRTSNLPTGDRLPELWVIGGDGTPRSLGLVALNGATAFAAPATLRGYLEQGATFALTLEPRAGAPHAAPSGEILSTAKLALL